MAANLLFERGATNPSQTFLGFHKLFTFTQYSLNHKPLDTETLSPGWEREGIFFADPSSLY